MSSGRARLGGVVGVGMEVWPLLEVADRPDMPKGSDALPLPASFVEATEANGSVLYEKAAMGLAEGRLADGGAAPKGSPPKGSVPKPDGAGAVPKGSVPNASGAAAAGASLEVEKVDQTSAPGEPASSQKSIQISQAEPRIGSQDRELGKQL